jgi:uncharacterized protein
LRTISSGTEAAFENLKKYLATLKSAAIAYSGGVDSTLLLYVASIIPDLELIAYTIKNEMIPLSEIESAIISGKKFGVNHQVIDVDILSFNKISANMPDRCYHCKTVILNKIINEAKAIGINTILEGSHSGDINDYRPGLKAINELGVLSPLKDAGFDKNKIYELSVHLELPTSDKESYPCLATRIPYGTSLTGELLKKAELAEKILASFGFRQIRARIHGDILRIEIDQSMIENITSSPSRENVCAALQKVGFMYITLDLQGYRTGSMNLKIEGEK